MKKKATRNGKTSVTFELPSAVVAERAVVVGDFNGWAAGKPMRRRRDGSFSATYQLTPGRYRYRYLLDDERWENDWSADAYEPNDYGSEDSVLVL